MNALSELGSDIETVMSRYNVPMDDRSIIMDRVAETVNKIAALSARVAKSGHDNGQKLAKRAILSSAQNRVLSQKVIKAMKKKATSAIRHAYVSGVNNGSRGKYSTTHLAVVSAIALVAGVLIYREIF